MAAKTSLTPQVQKTIVEAIGRAMYREVACQLAGITRQTLWNWEQRGEAGEEPYASFLAELRKSEAEAEDFLVAQIREGASNWQSKAWIAERRWPKRWAQRVRQNVTEELDAFTDRLQKRLDDATYRKVLDASREDAQGEAAKH